MKRKVSQSISGSEDILISTKKRPVWQKILAALCYTTTGIFLYIFFVTVDFNADSEMAHFYGNTIELAGIMFVLGVRFSLVKDYYFDLKNKQYKIMKRVGLVEIGKWKKFQDLDYVSVFKNSKGILEINLWYNQNNHFNMGQGETLPLALKAGKQIAQKLQIDILDAATNPYQSEWVSLH